MEKATRVRRILETIRAIPHGSVASYGQIAEIAGVPRGARQVAYALRNVPAGQQVPWHRVVQASGRIAFETGSPAFRRQQDRLRDEGVRVNSGRIDMSVFRWQPDLDELLWKPSSAWDES